MTMALLHYHAAINGQDLTGDERGIIRNKERYCFGDVFRCTRSTQWRGFDCCILVFLRQDIRQIRCDKTGCNRIDRDVARTQFLRQCFRQADQAGFRRRIICLPRVTGDTDD